MSAYRFASEELVYAGRRWRGRPRRRSGGEQEVECDELFQEPEQDSGAAESAPYRSTQPEKYATLFLRAS